MFGKFFEGLGGALGGALGGFLTQDMDRKNADHAMDRSDNMAREQMAFQERMSNTSYQRATADMKAAGINPMVAFQQGGASTPAGAMGQAVKANSPNVIGGALSSALDVMRLRRELDQGDSQIALNAASASKALADAKASASSAKHTETLNKVLDSQAESLKKEAEYRSQKTDIDRHLLKYDAIMGRASRDIGTGSKLLKMLNPFGGKGTDTIIDGGTGEILMEKPR